MLVRRSHYQEQDNYAKIRDVCNSFWPQGAQKFMPDPGMKYSSIAKSYLACLLQYLFAVRAHALCFEHCWNVHGCLRWQTHSKQHRYFVVEAGALTCHGHEGPWKNAEAFIGGRGLSKYVGAGAPTATRSHAGAGALAHLSFKSRELGVSGVVGGLWLPT